MDSRTVFVLLWMLLSSTSTGIKLDGNGYVDITIAISSKVPQDNTLIDKIKDMVTEGSFHLHQALDKKVYFKEATILVPPHWNSEDFTRARTESFEKAKIIIDTAKPAYGDEPYTHQYGQCGAEGQYIHFTPNFLKDDTPIKLYGSRGRVLVHEWAHLRWGVFDEYSDTKPFYYSNGHIEATGCSNNIEGQFYDESLQPCHTDPKTLQPTKGCKFFPNKYQKTDSSIMFLPSLDSVISFCRENEHNYEAPNLQNKKCGNKATRTVIFEDSVDKDALRSLKPMPSSPPVPSFKIVQRMHRVVCLVLDVSGSMQGSRILRLQQAATYFLRDIIEEQASVGIVTFSTDASTLSPLNTIDNDSTREKLIKLLPNAANGWTYMCKGLNLGLQVLKKDNGDVLGDEIIFLTDGEASDDLNSCVPSAIESGAIIHTIALGDKADKALREMADKTGRVFVHEWAHLRWGVFDEYSETKPFYHSKGRIEATRCSTSIEGLYYVPTADGSLQPCRIDPQTALPADGCKFFPNANQNTDSSIMYQPSLDSVITFCQANDHNYEATNPQNDKCDKPTWNVIFEDSVDKHALRSLEPMPSSPPAPSFKIVQRIQRVICLILDVSGSMTTESRILRLRQAATYLLRDIIEEQASVGIVTFSSDAYIQSILTTIDNDSTREKLIELLPKTASGGTYVCKGLTLGLQELATDNLDVLGDEIIFLTDGEASDNINDCKKTAINSGAIIHTIALSENADHALKEMADKTAGKFIYVGDDVNSNQLMDAFASLTLSTGDYTKEPVQLESVGKTTSDWFNGTVTVDQTVGNKTNFVIIYETRVPIISIQSPSGSIYSETEMSHEVSLKTVSLKLPGTAETGDWKYSIQSPLLQSLTITVTSQAARADVPPIMVKTHMNQQLSDGTKPMIVFAEVSQNYKPVIKAEVWATLESETGSAQTLQLLDNGAGADAFKDDGVYSRYFTQMKNGRSSLKVRVKNQDGQARFSQLKRGGAPYVPGYVVNGVVKLNPPKPPVSEEPLEVGSFTRTATGESFEVAFTGSTPPNFPPNKITDLSAEIQEDSVLLSWTAPGEDLDQGTAKSYEIRWSYDLQMLRESFSNGHAVNTTAVSPHEAGSVEQHSFNFSFPIQNGTTLFFAVQSEDKEKAKSETSNIAQASKILLDPKPQGISNPGINLTVLVISLCVVTMVICFVAALTTWAVRRRKHHG